jgi:hypothetical protein
LLAIQKEAESIAKQIGFAEPTAGLIGRCLIVSAKNHLPPESLFPLTEFCAERALQLEIHQMLR